MYSLHMWTSEVWLTSYKQQNILTYKCKTFLWVDLLLSSANFEVIYSLFYHFGMIQGLFWILCLIFFSIADCAVQRQRCSEPW